MTEPLTFTFDDDGSIPNSTSSAAGVSQRGTGGRGRHRAGLRRQSLAAGMAQRRASVSPLP